MPPDNGYRKSDWFSDMDTGFPSKPGYNMRPGTWMPAMDMYATATHVVVIAELPGIRKEDITVVYENGYLTIGGVKRKSFAGAKGCSFFFVERSFGAFKRSFRVILPVDAAEMEVTHDAGILTVLLPKSKKNSEREG